MTISFEEWRRTHPPMAGGEDPPAADPPASGDPPSGDPPADPPSGDPPVEDPPSDDPAAVLRAENQRLKREAAAREKERRKAESEAKKAEDARKAQQGEWQKLAEERQAKITELEGQIADRDRKDAQREQRDLVKATAERLNFKRPHRAFALLVDELGDKAEETFADQQLVEAALKRLGKAEPELVDTRPRTGAPVGGNGAAGEQDPARALNQNLAWILGESKR
jgi:hypothetical protein